VQVAGRLPRDTPDRWSPWLSFGVATRSTLGMHPRMGPELSLPPIAAGWLLHPNSVALGALPLSFLVVDVPLQFLHWRFALLAGHCVSRIALPCRGAISKHCGVLGGEIAVCVGHSGPSGLLEEIAIIGTEGYTVPTDRITPDQALSQLKALKESLEQSRMRNFKPSPEELYHFKYILVLLQMSGFNVTAATWEVTDPESGTFPHAYQVLAQVDSLIVEVEAIAAGTQPRQPAFPVQKGYTFIIMAMKPDDPQLADIHATHSRGLPDAESTCRRRRAHFKDQRQDHRIHTESRGGHCRPYT
jgi:hypothetical protein